MIIEKSNGNDIIRVDSEKATNYEPDVYINQDCNEIRIDSVQAASLIMVLQDFIDGKDVD